jgi:hypothetical protein
VSAKEESRENGCVFYPSPALCGVYHLVILTAKMLRLRTAFWLTDAPLRLIASIGGYQESKNMPLSTFWFAYVFYEENHNGWL